MIGRFLKDVKRQLAPEGEYFCPTTRDGEESKFPQLPFPFSVLGFLPVASHLPGKTANPVLILANSLK